LPGVTTITASGRLRCCAEQPAREHIVRGDADAQVAQRGQDLRLDATRDQRVLDLQVGDRVHRVRPADRVGADLGQAEYPACTSSAIAPTVSSIGTSGSSRAGR
jgi:hypothetical protein